MFLHRKSHFGVSREQTVNISDLEAEHSEVAPDLDSGSLLNGIGTANVWTTEIQCALLDESRGTWTYLAQECRAENVPFSKEAEAASDGIFQRGRSLEFLILKSDNLTHQLSSSEYLLVDGLDGGRTAYPAAIDLTGQCDTVVRCAPRAITPLEIVDAMEGLRDGELDVRSTFLKVRWENEGGPFQLFCPCRYVNLPASSEAETPYVQPISGYVLYPDGNRHIVGYVACALSPGNDAIIEFCCRTYSNVFSRLAAVDYLPSPMRPILDNLSNILPMGISTMDSVVTVDGTASLYRYFE